MNTAFDPSVDGSRSAGGKGHYGCTLNELKELMTLHGVEAYHKLQDDYKPGGVLELCRRLQTSPVNGSRSFQQFSYSLSLSLSLLLCMQCSNCRRGWGSWEGGAHWSDP